jgi:hypothetical protein
VAIDTVHGRRPTLRGSLDLVRERLAPLVGALGIATVGIAIGLVAIIPGVYLLIVWLFVAPAVVVEGRPIRSALGRSADLVRSAWWRVFVTFLVVRVLVGVAEAILVTPVSRALARLSYGPEVITVSVWRTVVGVLVEPFALAALALLYLDRRVRLEGAWPELEARPPPPTAEPLIE